MTETWCAMLNVLILSIVAGANGVLIQQVLNRGASAKKR